MSMNIPSPTKGLKCTGIYNYILQKVYWYIYTPKGVLVYIYSKRCTGIYILQKVYWYIYTPKGVLVYIYSKRCTGIYICSTQSENLRDLQIALRNLRILRTEANLQIVTQSADCYAICKVDTSITDLRRSTHRSSVFEGQHIHLRRSTHRSSIWLCFLLRHHHRRALRSTYLRKTLGNTSDVPPW